ncbi:MAG: M48 family metallopeptidase [Alphaproteobacteria bacterium]
MINISEEMMTYDLKMLKNQGFEVQAINPETLRLGLMNGIARIAEKANLSCPMVYVVTSEKRIACNIPMTGSLAFSDGYLKDEKYTLDDVLCSAQHEFGHLLSRDIVIKGQAIDYYAGGITKLVLFGASCMAIWGFLTADPQKNTSLTVAIASTAANITSSLVSKKFARDSEYAADEIGAYLGGNPLAIISSLQKITNAANNHRHPILGRLFNKHPSISERVLHLKEVAQNLHEDGTVINRQKIPSRIKNLPSLK